MERILVWQAIEATVAELVQLVERGLDGAGPDRRGFAVALDELEALAWQLMQLAALPRQEA